MAHNRNEGSRSPGEQQKTDNWSVHLQAWPKFSPDLIKEENVTIPVQVNGKLRGTVVVSTDSADNIDKVVSIAKQNAKIAKWLEGKRVKKIIFVPQKLVNFVVS